MIIQPQADGPAAWNSCPSGSPPPSGCTSRYGCFVLLLGATSELLFDRRTPSRFSRSPLARPASAPPGRVQAGCPADSTPPPSIMSSQDRGLAPHLRDLAPSRAARIRSASPRRDVKMSGSIGQLLSRDHDPVLRAPRKIAIATARAQAARSSRQRPQSSHVFLCRRPGLRGMRLNAADHQYVRAAVSASSCPHVVTVWSGTDSSERRCDLLDRLGLGGAHALPFLPCALPRPWS